MIWTEVLASNLSKCHCVMSSPGITIGLSGGIFLMQQLLIFPNASLRRHFSFLLKKASLGNIFMTGLRQE